MKFEYSELFIDGMKVIGTCTWKYDKVNKARRNTTCELSIFKLYCFCIKQCNFEWSCHNICPIKFIDTEEVAGRIQKSPQVAWEWDLWWLAANALVSGRHALICDVASGCT